METIVGNDRNILRKQPSEKLDSVRTTPKIIAKSKK